MYDKFDEEFPNQVRTEKRFRNVVNEITETLGDTITATVFRRPPLLYSLFCVLYHHRYGLPSAPIANTNSKPLSRDGRLSLREAVESLSSRVEAAREGGAVPPRFATFINACSRQTDNIEPRETRFKVLYTTAFN